QHPPSFGFARLSESRGKDWCFFVFANPVRARTYQGGGECHGWLGIRLQLAPMSEPHDILIHVRMLDDDNVSQMQALGIVGVNLIYAAYYYRDDLKKFTESLLDEVNVWRIEIDMLKFSGPGFSHIDNRLCVLQLVNSGLTDAALFSHDGEVMQPAEHLYKKPILLLRGSFNPITRINLDMLDSARKEFTPQLGTDAEFVEILECTTQNLLVDGEIDPDAFLRRADAIQALGKTVLVSRFAEFHRLGSYLSRYTSAPIGIILGVSLLEAIFDEKWYEELPGGILESFGRLFKNKIRLYVYPSRAVEGGPIQTGDQAQLAPHLRNLFAHLLENGFIEPIPSNLVDCLHFSSADVRRMKAESDDRWKTLVPESIVSHFE
ncbi:MAG: TonB-dependent receptor, partial [Verrucomicrobiota bacterium]